MLTPMPMPAPVAIHAPAEPAPEARHAAQMMRNKLRRAGVHVPHVNRQKKTPVRYFCELGQHSVGKPVNSDGVCGSCAAQRRPEFEPTPEELQAALAEVRSSWPAPVAAKRMVYSARSHRPKRTYRLAVE